MKDSTILTIIIAMLLTALLLTAEKIIVIHPRPYIGPPQNDETWLRFPPFPAFRTN